MGREACELTKEIRGVEYSCLIQADRSTVMSSLVKADDIMEAVSRWLRQVNNKKHAGRLDADLHAQIVQIIES